MAARGARAAGGIAAPHWRPPASIDAEKKKAPERRVNTNRRFRRRFPPPWSVDNTDVCFIVRDPNGHCARHVYFEESRGEYQRAGDGRLLHVSVTV
jgi:hypothetical protein